jgi:hypothetical protein
MTNVEKVLEYFNSKPGMLKTSRNVLAAKLNVEIKDINEAKKIIRENNSPTINELDNFATEQGFDPNDASVIWYKSKHLSVAVKNKQTPLLNNDTLLEFLNGYDFPSITPIKHYTSNNTVGIINIFDAHIDKLAINGKGGLDEVQTNLNILFNKFKQLLADVLLDSPQTIIFPIGNDFFNTNGSEPATKRGTPQPYTTHWQDSFQLGVEFYRKCIDTIISYCDIYIPIIPGNHDTDKMFFLSQVLKAVYKNQILGTIDANQVTINDDKIPYKFCLINGVMFGFEHGQVGMKKIRDLPTVMAISKPKMWADANHRVMFLGDKHHKNETRVMQTLEHNGVDIKFLRASTNADIWHTNEMWIGAKKSISASTYSNEGNYQRNYELFF